MNFILARLKESSTWRGLLILATIAGATLNPEQIEAIVAVGIALGGLVEVFREEKVAGAVAMKYDPTLTPTENVKKSMSLADTPDMDAGSGD